MKKFYFIYKAVIDI